MRGVRALSLLLAAMLFGEPRPATGEAARVLVVGPANAAVVACLEDELAGQGMAVDVQVWDLLPSWRVLREMVRAHDAVAAIAVAPQLDELEIWVVERATGKATVRSVEVPSGEPEESARVGALRAVELLRVSLRDLEEGPPPSEAGAAPPSLPAVPAPAPESSPSWDLAVAGGMLWSVGGLEPVATIAVGLRWRPWEFLAVGLAASFPLSETWVRGVEGTAEIRPWWVLAEVRWEPLEGRGLFQPDLGVGLGAVILAMRGMAEEPFVGQEDVVAAFAGNIAAGFEVRPIAALGIRLDTWLGLTIPELGVVFGDRRSARWGRPFVGTSLALDVHW